jgi:membrane dipeptidase
VCTTAAAVEDAAAAGITAVIPAVENGYAIGADLGRIQRLRELGACYITLTHNGHNRVADSAIARRDLNDAEAEHGGLSAFGRAAVAEMNRVGLLVDVSHVSRAGMLQAAELSRTPIVATHACCRALCDHPRNLDDSQLDVLKATGGLLQVTAVPSFLRLGGKVASVSVADFVDHIDHAVRRMGVGHVGIGSDFDGGGEMQGWHDASESRNVTAELVVRGYDEEAIAALWGGNFLRVMRKAEAATA